MKEEVIIKEEKYKKKKEKKKFKTWEKIFIIFNIIFIIICISFYSYRLVHFYKKEHAILSDNKLAVFLTNQVVYKGDGLYQDQEDKNYYYYKGKVNNNYVWYSGRLWRIVNINKDTIKLITEENQTSLVWGYKQNYNNSYIKEWLTRTDNSSFIKSLDNYDKILEKSNYCIDEISEDNITCNEKDEITVGLLSVSEYLLAGGKNSYLNNNSYWWLINASKDNKAWYVFPEGGINDESFDKNVYYSYGVRPTITISNSSIKYSGDGTKNNPYVILNDNAINLSIKSVGSYIKYGNYTWRIQGQYDNYTKLIMDGVLHIEDKEYTSSYSNTIKYLNNTFSNTLDKENLTSCNFNNGSFGKNSNYNYKNAFSKKVQHSVGIPSIGELFITDYHNYWLFNSFDNSNLLQYTINNNGGFFADQVDSLNYVRPVICINNDLLINDGNGMQTNPYILEVSNENNN